MIPNRLIINLDVLRNVDQYKQLHNILQDFYSIAKNATTEGEDAPELIDWEYEE